MTEFIAFTGHRPQDLPQETINYQRFAASLDALGCHQRKDIAFVAGGALGVDTWAATYALMRGIPLHLILPFLPEVQGKFWTEFQRTRLIEHIHDAASVEVLNTGAYDVADLQRRNVAMVDKARAVFAVWSGKRRGGTFNCIQYALKVDKPVYNMWPLDGKLHPLKEV